VNDESRGQRLGDDAEPLPPGVGQVIEGWLAELKDSGNGLLETCGPARLRRVCEQWIALGGVQPGLDGPVRRCSPADLQTAARALQDRARAAFPMDTEDVPSRQAVLGLSRALRAASREPVPDQHPPSRGALPPSPLTEALSHAVAIQAATSAQGIARALLDAAIQLCHAASAVWWEQEGPAVLSAKVARGIRLPRRERTVRLPAGFWRGAGRRGQHVHLSAESAAHAPLLKTVGASRGCLLRARAGRRWIGAMSVHDGDLDPECMDSLIMLTQQAALALHALDLSAEPRQLVQGQQRVTTDIGLALTSALSLDELLQVICRSAIHLLKAECCFLFLAEDGGPLRHRATECLGHTCQQIEDVALLAAAEHTRNQPTGRFLWHPSRRLPVPNAATIRKAGIQSMMGIALSVRGQPVGALLLLSPTRHVFDPARRQLIVSFAAQAAVGIENLLLVEDMQRRLLEVADLTWVSTRVTSTLDVRGIAATIADAAAKSLDAPHVALFIARPDGDLEPLAGGQIGLAKGRKRALPGRDHLGAKALSTGAPQSASDAEQDNLAGDALVQWFGTRSVLCVPMVAQQGLRGILAVADDQARTFRTHEIALLSAYANQAALALQSALLYDDVVRHLGQLRNLFEISQTLASSLQLGETLERVLDSASEIFASPRCSLMLMEPKTQTLVIRGARGLTADEALYSPLKLGEGLAGRAAQSETPLVSADVTRDGRFRHRDRARELGLRTAMAAPLVTRGRTIGVLNLYRPSSRPFTSDDKRLVMLLTNSAAVAIENARLYQEAQERGQFLGAMMGEINHRVRNTFQTVAGLLRLELERPTQASPEDVLRRGIARLHSVAIVHDLMPGQDLEFVDIKRAATHIADLTCQTAAPDRTLRTHVSGARVMLPSQSATSVALILSELTDNAVRHGLAGRDDGLVSISLAEGGGDVVIQVRDNGVGLPDHFDLATMSGLGLKIVRGLVEHDLGGTLDFEVRHGLTVRARFPKHR
jgi:GAF domain-containing protein/GNAT superfamily N-acetyltransferase